MVTVHDVAAFILREKGRMTTMKLQKLVYYSQAWSLVWDEAPLFSEQIQAWANGPVVYDLYCAHRGQFDVTPPWTASNAKPDALTEEQQETVRSVLEFYGEKSSQWLSDLTHMEKPWNDARKGIPAGVASSREISLASMAEYYGSLKPA